MSKRPRASQSHDSAHQPCAPTLDVTLSNFDIFHPDCSGPLSKLLSFACAAAEWPMLDLVGVGFFGFMRCTALSAGSEVITQSYRKPCDTRSPKGVDGLVGRPKAVFSSKGFFSAAFSLPSLRRISCVFLSDMWPAQARVAG